MTSSFLLQNIISSSAQIVSDCNLYDRYLLFFYLIYKLVYPNYLRTRANSAKIRTFSKSALLICYKLAKILKTKNKKNCLLSCVIGASICATLPLLDINLLKAKINESIDSECTISRCTARTAMQVNMQLYLLTILRPCFIINGPNRAITVWKNAGCPF